MISLIVLLTASSPAEKPETWSTVLKKTA